MVHHLCSSLLISTSLSPICPRRHRSLPFRHWSFLSSSIIASLSPICHVIVDLCLFVVDLSPIRLHRKHRPLCLFVTNLSPIHQSMLISLSHRSVSDSPIYDYLSHALGSNLGIFWWVCYLVLGGGFVIWFWMGMVCGGPVVRGICLMVFCGGPVVVDGGWVWVLWFVFGFEFGFGFVILFWVCFCLWFWWLWVEVVGNGGCGNRCGHWWLAAMGVGSGFKRRHTQRKRKEEIDWEWKRIKKIKK